MPYERGDVVLLELAFSDGTARKKRPALIVVNASFLAGTSDLIVCAITSQQRAERVPGATAVRSWEEAGLLKPSVVKASLHTIDRALVDRRLGRLTPQDLTRVDDSLKSVLF
jgi:mRNA-degrading endonuclease toxin of MazEF toxin-antitoxin module